MIFDISLKDNQKKNINWNTLNLKLLNKKKCIIFKKYNNIISEKKSLIDTPIYNNKWDKMKKNANPYELVYTTFNKKKKKDSIANYKPISRSFFKLLEIDNMLNLIGENDNNFIANLAEGPGGFMEALIKKYFGKKKLQLYGFTLPPSNKYIPDWSKIKKNFLLKNVNISYGNLYKIEDIKKFLKLFNGNKCSLSTADGGFDYSKNFNGQEIDSYRIIFSEIFVSFLLLEQGGNFVCKFFDIFTLFTIKMLYILGNCFEKVYITKPNTSRQANSEKYIVCKGFIGINDDMEQCIYKLFDKMENIVSLNNNFVLDFDNLNITNDFIQRINDINEIYTENQMSHLDKVFKLIEDDDFDNKIDDIKTIQVNNAVQWCIENNIKINKESYFYTKYFKN